MTTAFTLLKQAALAPIYLYQANQVKKSALILPEPKGARHGKLMINEHLPDTKPLNIKVVGDSSAAGVGCKLQTEGLAQNLVINLQSHFKNQTANSNYSAIHWSLNAKSGDSSFDLLKRLFVLPAQPVDVMVICIGVNDVTKNMSLKQWQKNIHDIIAISQRKFGARFIIFSSLPLMGDMPALPLPLNHFLGAKARQLDEDLKRSCENTDGVYYFAPRLTNTDTKNISPMFASDGFHPSLIAYQLWASQLADHISHLL